MCQASLSQLLRKVVGIEQISGLLQVGWLGAVVAVDKVVLLPLQMVGEVQTVCSVAVLRFFEAVRLFQTALKQSPLLPLVQRLQQVGVLRLLILLKSLPGQELLSKFVKTAKQQVVILLPKGLSGACCFENGLGVRWFGLVLPPVIQQQGHLLPAVEGRAFQKNMKQLNL